MATTNERLAQLERVMIRHSGPGGTYGLDMRIEDVSWEVREEIADQLRDGVIVGRVTVGGQSYRWWIAD